jgi:hypothetical protein
MMVYENFLIEIYDMYDICPFFGQVNLGMSKLPWGYTNFFEGGKRAKCRAANADDFFVLFSTWHLIEPKAQTNWWQIDAWNSALSDSLRELFLLDLTFISCIVDSCKARLSQTKWLSQSCFSQRRASRFFISLFGFAVNLVLMQAIWQCWAVRTSFKVLFILSRGQVFEILDQLMVCSTSSPPNLVHVWNLPKKCEIRKLPFPFVSGQLRCTQLCSTNLALFNIIYFRANFAVWWQYHSLP